MTLEILDRHSEALFEFLWCPVCGQEVFTHIPFEGVFCKNCNTQVELQESRETRGYEDAVLACFDTTTTWNLHVDEKLRRDLPDGSARVKILGAPGAYKVDWWSPEPGEDWEPVERGEFDDVDPIGRLVDQVHDAGDSYSLPINLVRERHRLLNVQLAQ